MASIFRKEHFQVSPGVRAMWWFREHIIGIIAWLAIARLVVLILWPDAPVPRAINYEDHNGVGSWRY